MAITTGAHHDDVNVHVVADAPGIAESRLGGAEGVAGTDEEPGEWTPRRTLGGIKCPDFVGCWGLGGMDL